MTTYRSLDKDISKLFGYLHTELETKEKELLQLQRADPSFLMPDVDQIEMLTDAIKCLHLSTQDGAFVIASSPNYETVSTPTPSLCSIDFNNIKNLPSNVWLAPSNSPKQQSVRRPSIFNHLLALPLSTYLPALEPPKVQPLKVQASVQKRHRTTSQLSLVDHLISMPINAYLSSSPTSKVEPPKQSRVRTTSNSLVDHLLSMPLDAYLSSSQKPKVEAPIKPRVRTTSNSIVDHLLSMPLNAFKSSSMSPALVEVKPIEIVPIEITPNPEKTTNSLVNTGMMFSKERWLRN